MTCPICNSKETVDFEVGVLRCLSCDTIFRTNVTSASKTRFFDDKKSIKVSFKEKLKTKLVRGKFWNLVAFEYFNYIKSHTDITKIKTALDVGTYYGHLVKILNENGVDARGIESDKFNFAQRVTDKIENSWFDEDYDDSRKYDLICLTQMVYYMPDNLTFFKKIHGMLNPNGFVFIATNNPQSSIHLKKKFPSFSSPHINIFLGKKGYELIPNFKILDYTTYWSDLFMTLNFGKKSELIKFLLGLKKPSRKDEDGFHTFILLQKIDE